MYNFLSNDDNAIKFSLLSTINFVRRWNHYRKFKSFALERVPIQISLLVYYVQNKYTRQSGSREQKSLYK